MKKHVECIVCGGFAYNDELCKDCLAYYCRLRNMKPQEAELILEEPKKWRGKHGKKTKTLG